MEATNNYPQSSTVTANVEQITLANMVDILEQERKRIAYDIHDSVQHSLRLISDIAPAQIKQEIDKVINNLREICYRLTPKSLDEFSLTEYLPIYVVTLQRSCKFYIDYRGNAISNLPAKVETQLFGIINEAMTNIMKYAEQTPIVFIRFWEDEEKFVLSIQDLGKGFDTTQSTNTIGLKSMSGRAEMIHATFDIQSTIGEGTKIKVFLPKANVPPIDTTQIPNPTQQTVNSQTVPTTTEEPQENEIDTNLIYIVDNQEEIGIGLKEIIEEAFKDRDYKIVVFTKPDDATMALRVLNEAKEPQPAIIISDITMPNKSGFVFIKEAQAISPNSKYIIYTVNDMPVYIAKAVKELKVNAFICKEEEWDNEEHPMVSAIKQVGIGNFFSKKADGIRTQMGSLIEPAEHRPDSAKRYIFNICYKNKVKNINADFIDKSYRDIKDEIKEAKAICKEKLEETSIYEQIEVLINLENTDTSNIIKFLSDNLMKFPLPVREYIVEKYCPQEEEQLREDICKGKRKIYITTVNNKFNDTLKKEVIDKTQKITKDTIRRYFNDFYSKFVELSSVEKKILQEIPEIDLK